MVVQKGYKKTVVGVIPENWECRTISEAFEICNNLRLPINDVERKKMQGRYPYYGPTRIQDYINEYRVEGEYALIGEDGDHFFKYSTMPMTQLTSGRFNVNNHAHLVRGSKENITIWFYFYYRHRNITLYLTRQGAGRYKLNKTTLESLPIALPPKEEQNAIAETLSDADSLIMSLEKLITKKKAIKQGAMQELLTGKKRLPGFRGEWVEYRLGDIADIRTGKKNNDDKVINGQYPFFVRSQQVERIDTFSFDGEAILIPGEGNIGEIFHYINGKFDYHQRVYKINVLYTNISTKLIFYILKYSFGKYALQNTVKATVDSLRLPTFQNYTFSLPEEFDEQTAIANIFSDMDAEIEQLERKMAKYRHIKQGMMQELLTGRIRLVQPYVRPEVVADPKIVPAGHNQHYDDAIAISAIVNAFYHDRFPLGRVKVQKLLYFLRRKQDADVSTFKKKAAGPYNEEARYKGGESIAIKSKYIVRESGGKGSIFSKGSNIDEALKYVGTMQTDIDWLFEKFRFYNTKKMTNNLEVLATVDMAACELSKSGKDVSVEAVIDLIRSNKDWAPKLQKDFFTNKTIRQAIEESQHLFGQ